jgi:DNA-binding NtrC family response regulator
VTDDPTIEYQQRPSSEAFTTAYVRDPSSGTEREIVLEGTAIVGSGEGAAIRIEGDRLVSRVHAELEVRDDGVWVRDLGSTNGTFIDRVRIVQARIPTDGSVTVGGTKLEVRVGSEKRQVWPMDHFGPLLGSSATMRAMFHKLSRVAPADAPVLILGETGSGKELVARAIHDASPRSKRPFVVVDCGALPANLLESELFGHARGAFTGAVTTHVGAVEVAAGGTIFLDEIGELPIDMQPKLLRALESRTFRRLGETEHRPIAARFVAATHRDLPSMVNAGSFREDLLFRLNVLPIVVPPLRERRDDIGLIVEALVRARGAPPLEVPLEELASRPWPGNVRELRSFVERAITLGTGEALAMTTPGKAPAAAADGGAAGTGFPPVDVAVPFKDVRDRWIDHLERAYVTRALEVHGGNVTAVAESAGLARSYVHRLIRKHDLDR